mgnify:CR=1 FL=1|jgi:hypothetical protein
MSWLEGAVAVAGVVVAIVTGFTGPRYFKIGSKTKEEHIKEEACWEALRHTGQRAVADILGLARPAFRLVTWRNGSPNMAAAELLIVFRDAEGAEHRAVLRTFIDQELLANFSTGRQVPIVYAKEPTLRVAIDRDRTQLDIPSTFDA